MSTSLRDNSSGFLYLCATRQRPCFGTLKVSRAPERSPANLPDFRFGCPSTNLKRNSGVMHLHSGVTPFATLAPRAASLHSTLVSFRTYIGVRKCVRRLLESQIQVLSCFRDPPARLACVSAPNIVSLGRRFGVKRTHRIHRQRRPSGVARGGVDFHRIPTASPEPEGDRAGHRSRTSPNGMSVIAALHDPLAVLAANDLSDMVRPDDDRPDGWTAGIRSVVSP
jgi:hypothetical protein